MCCCSVPPPFSRASCWTVIAADLPVVTDIGSALRTEPQRNDGHGCFRSRGGRWLNRRASKPALVKYEGGIRLSSNATGGWGVQRGRGNRLTVAGQKWSLGSGSYDRGWDCLSDNIRRLVAGQHRQRNAVCSRR